MELLLMLGSLPRLHSVHNLTTIARMLLKTLQERAVAVAATIGRFSRAPHEHARCGTKLQRVRNMKNRIPAHFLVCVALVSAVTS